MSAYTEKHIFRVLLALMLPSLIALAVIDADLKNSVTPTGIISFELCAYTDSCNAALAAWGTKGQALALLSLGLDYLFLVAYAGLIGISLLWLAPTAPQALRKITVIAAGLALSAGLADAIENYFLIQLVLSGEATPYALSSSLFATLKFTLLSLTLPWLLFLLSRRVLQKQP